MGRPYGPPVALVQHSESGGRSGTIAEFVNSSSELSTHYAARLDGTLECYIDATDRAWSNGLLEPGNRWASIARECGIDPTLSPNHVTVSCDTEDGGDESQPVTDAQFNAVLYAGWEARLRFPDSLRFLARHSDISPHSRGGCPGDRWLASGRFQALADRLGLSALC